MKVEISLTLYDGSRFVSRPAPEGSDCEGCAFRHRIECPSTPKCDEDGIAGNVIFVPVEPQQ